MCEFLFESECSKRCQKKRGEGILEVFILVNELLYAPKENATLC